MLNKQATYEPLNYLHLAPQYATAIRPVVYCYLAVSYAQPVTYRISRSLFINIQREII